MNTNGEIVILEKHVFSPILTHFYGEKWFFLVKIAFFWNHDLAIAVHALHQPLIRSRQNSKEGEG